MIMQIIKGSYLRIDVIYKNNCDIGNTKIVMFLSQVPKNYSI